MGERKGVNKYYPPDYDPNKGGLNKFLGTHALRERARKLHLGILIIRFEMPYNIWCDGCGNHIGTGVRYNAEKKKVGMYYTTPIYQFRMKCHLCDNHFEIKTDPANLDYEIVSGARRQERRWDPSENDQVAPEDKAIGRKMAADAMFRLEHGAQDKEKAGALDSVMKDLEDLQESRWADDFSANQALRQKFRSSENAIKAQEKIDASYHLDVPLLPPSSDDARQASLLAVTRHKPPDAGTPERRRAVDAADVFAKLKRRRQSATQKKDVARQSIESIVAAGTQSFDTFTNDFSKGINVKGIVLKKRKGSAAKCASEKGGYLVAGPSVKRSKALNASKLGVCFGGVGAGGSRDVSSSAPSSNAGSSASGSIDISSSTTGSNTSIGCSTSGTEDNDISCDSKDNSEAHTYSSNTSTSDNVALRISTSGPSYSSSDTHSTKIMNGGKDSINHEGDVNSNRDCPIDSFRISADARSLRSPDHKIEITKSIEVNISNSKDCNGTENVNATSSSTSSTRNDTEMLSSTAIQKSDSSNVFCSTIAQDKNPAFEGDRGEYSNSNKCKQTSRCTSSFFRSKVNHHDDIDCDDLSASASNGSFQPNGSSSYDEIFPCFSSSETASDVCYEQNGSNACGDNSPYLYSGPRTERFTSNANFSPEMHSSKAPTSLLPRPRQSDSSRFIPVSLNAQKTCIPEENSRSNSSSEKTNEILNSFTEDRHIDNANSSGTLICCAQGNEGQAAVSSSSVFNLVDYSGSDSDA